jgi:hypothetical protein
MWDVRCGMWDVGGVKELRGTSAEVYVVSEDSDSLEL